MNYDPQNWYWLADDGRIFSSQRGRVIDSDDDDFVSWSETRAPTPWPRDDGGEQTDAALQEVLSNYGLYVGLDALKAGLKAAIDAQAERERLKYITPGAGQAMTYSRKVEQAKTVLAASDPQPADYPMLAASIGIDGADIVAVANTVVAMDAAWETIGAAIEAARLAAKRFIDETEDETAARAVQPIWPTP